MFKEPKSSVQSGDPSALTFTPGITLKCKEVIDSPGALQESVGSSLILYLIPFAPVNSNSSLRVIFKDCSLPSGLSKVIGITWLPASAVIPTIANGKISFSCKSPEHPIKPRANALAAKNEIIFFICYLQNRIF